MAKEEIESTSTKISTENRRHYKYRSSECLNCGQPLDLSDVYCPFCSQLNSTKPLSLKDFFNEFLGSIISYDSRFWHTIKDLLFYPGRITRRYIAGQRMRYVNPFRFFLSVSIVYFLLSGLFMNFSDEADDFKTGYNAAQNDQSIEKDTDKAFEYDGDILKINGDKDTIKDSFEDYYISEDSLSKMGGLKRYFSRFEMYYSFHDDHKDFTTKQALDSLKQEHTANHNWMYNRTLRLENIITNPKDYAQYLFSKIPFFLFFLAPIYAIAFWVLYYRKKHNYTEHLIFLYHIFTFLFLGLLISIIPDLILGQDYIAAILFCIIGPLYTYKAMRNYYKQKRWKTIIKFVLLNFTFSIVTIFAMAAFILGTAALY